MWLSPKFLSVLFPILVTLGLHPVPVYNGKFALLNIAGYHHFLLVVWLHSKCREIIKLLLRRLWCTNAALFFIGKEEFLGKNFVVVPLPNF